MKNLELKELGVQEMNATEMTNVNGGLLGISIDLGPLFAQLNKTVTEVVSFVTTQVKIVGAILGAL
ncbi:hypothetical protein [Mucilaginibacter sp. RCC_168]|uniref:hypothetical protein n=1 Tax=unclassified Mucilaginibacter TaxID=2617802 RepID=UPI0035240A2C